MGATNYQSALSKRYSKLTGLLANARSSISRIKAEQNELPRLEAKIAELQPLIESLGILLKAEDPEWKPDRAPPIMPWTYGITPIPFGSVSRRGMQVLQEASRAMSAREIALEVLRRAGEHDPPSELVLRTTTTIQASLRKFAGRTVESSGKYPAQWRVIHKGHVEFEP